MDQEDNSKTNTSHIQPLILEGFTFLHCHDYLHSVIAFAKALSILDEVETTETRIHQSINCLLASARAKIGLGDANGALKDAERAVVYSSKNEKYVKLHCDAFLQKAQAHFHMGDFENALIFFNSGLNLGPKDESEFKQGVNKSVDAIKRTLDLVNGQRLRFLQNRNQAKALNLNSKGGMDRKELTGQSLIERSELSKPYLDELNEDKVFLEKLVKDECMASKSMQSVKEIVKESLKYLDSRSEFWRVREFRV